MYIVYFVRSDQTTKLFSALLPGTSGLHDLYEVQMWKVKVKTVSVLN